MTTPAQLDTHARYIERDTERKIRHRNKLYYRFNHWPIWIIVFFIAPGPLTFDLFERGFDRRMAVWLGIVLLGTGIAGLRGRLPGVEPKPYIIRFTEDRPNPLYRRVCYTLAWSEAIAFALLNIAGLVVAMLALTGTPGRLRALMAIAALAAYAGIATAGPSVWRATTMAVIYLAARSIDHRTPPWQATALAAAVMTALAPLDVVNPGFALTFGATCALVEGARWIRRRPRPVRRST